MMRQTVRNIVSDSPISLVLRGHLGGGGARCTVSIWWSNGGWNPVNGVGNKIYKCQRYGRWTKRQKTTVDGGSVVPKSMYCKKIDLVDHKYTGLTASEWCIV